MTHFRPLAPDEAGLLEEFVYLAIFQPDPSNLLPRSVVRTPEFAVYTEGWGRSSDICWVAVDERAIDAVYSPGVEPVVEFGATSLADGGVPGVGDGGVVGAAWARVFTAGQGALPEGGFGTIDAHTPEIVISVKESCRGRGIGEELMRRLLDSLRERGCARASLSVQKANAAVRLYRRLGFTVIHDHGDEYVMLIELGPESADGWAGWPM